eukprot:g13305.t1
MLSLLPVCQDVLTAGKGARNFTTFSEAFQKYQQFTEYLHKQGSDSPFGFHKFLTDYQQYMDFNHFLGKGADHQSDAASNFQEIRSHFAFGICSALCEQRVF